MATTRGDKVCTLNQVLREELRVLTSHCVGKSKTWINLQKWTILFVVIYPLPKKTFRSSKDLPIMTVMIISPLNFANTFWIPLWNLVRLVLRFPKPTKGNVNISKTMNCQGFASSKFSKSARRVVLIFQELTKDRTTMFPNPTNPIFPRQPW